MTRQAKFAGIFFLTLVSTAMATQDWPAVLAAQETAQLAGLTGRSPSTPTRAGKADPTIAVRVYDYVQVPEALGNAQELVAKIFREAGIIIVWRDCLGLTGGQERELNCGRTESESDVELRVVPRLKAPPGVRHDMTLGFATGRTATVSWERVLELAHCENMNIRWQILGRTIAHEIGHVLLGSYSHSSSGIMHGRWNSEDLQFEAARYMWFTPKESEALRERIIP